MSTPPSSSSASPSKRPPLQPPKGTRDFYPTEMAARRHVEQAWRSASIDCGFDEIEGPTFEHLELYTVKSGEGIVNELFSFRRAGGDTDYALRPEFTPTLARMIAARGGSLPTPVKWFAIPSHYRAERPQRGRLREFVQWNVDLVGIESDAADVEVIAAALLALERLGLGPDDVQVRLSHRGAIGRALATLGVPDDRLGDAFGLLDRRDKLDPAAFAGEAAGMGLDGAQLARFEAFSRLRSPLSGDLGAFAAELGLGADAMGPIESLRDALRASDLDSWCCLDPGIVRGLAYYTGTVFEIHTVSGAERALAGGGRYDGLVELFGGAPTPAVGFGMGDVVLSLVLAERGLLGGDDDASLLPRPDVFIIADGSDDAEAALRPLVARLRRAGLHARHTYRTTRNVKKLIGEASRLRARSAVILGRELAEGAVVLKDFDSGEQESIALDAVESTLLARRAGTD